MTDGLDLEVSTKRSRDTPHITMATMISALLSPTRSQERWLCLLWWTLPSSCVGTSAFHVVPAITTRGLARHPSSLHVLPPVADFFDTSTTLILSDDTTTSDIPIDQAFQDSVDLFDLSGPLGGILLATVAAIAILVLLKALTGQMDAAIEKVLVDFESTLKENYPQRWRVVEAELEKVSPEERPAKLVSIMEKMQEEEPEFMSQVKEKMTDWKS